MGNMEAFDAKVKDMLEVINRVGLQRQRINEGEEAQEISGQILKELQAIPIHGEASADFKNGGKLALKEFKNFHDHFKKLKYSENMIYQCLEQIRSKCLGKLQYPNKICF